ncbi:unnamed protein product [Trifolium pratense]|uniref:Uncharacterized protein n=1 Tax=Trifolium pratense TaxID=57577 RepID=A0ACB0KBC2_TRIPR|nr:unnamed protein product [Trifolium pratense]
MSGWCWQRVYLAIWILFWLLTVKMILFLRQIKWKFNQQLDPTLLKFAKPIYLLLEELHMFSDLPSTGKALGHGQKMLLDVNRGEALDAKTVSVAIRNQTDKFKTIVAVVDASALAGIRKHLDTPLPGVIKEIVGELIMDSDGKGVLPMSMLTKVVTFKTPASLKIVLSQMQKVLSVALGPSKVVALGFATSEAKTSGFMKAAASAEKIRTVTQRYSLCGKTSVSVMRTAFYEIMRKRKIQRVGFLPWATFAGSIGTCTCLLLYGDGIEFANWRYIIFFQHLWFIFTLETNLI